VREFELDFAISEPGLGRFRVECVHAARLSCDGPSYITADMPRMESLGLPEVMTDLVLMKRGLILMGGSTGSGSQLAGAMIQLPATRMLPTTSSPSRTDRVPAHQQALARESARGGIDTKSYGRALRGVVRAALWMSF